MDYLKTLIENEYDTLNNDNELCNANVNIVYLCYRKCIEVIGKYFEQCLQVLRLVNTKTVVGKDTLGGPTFIKQKLCMLFNI